MTMNEYSSTINEKMKIHLYSGDNAGTFFTIATKLCNEFNKQTSKFICKVHESKGSLENLYLIKENKNSFGIIKSPEFYKQFNNVDYNFNALKLVKKTHDEFLTILVNKQVGIKNLKDLNGKRVNIGYIGSGNRIVIEKYFNKFNIIPSKIFDLGAGKSFERIENGELDAWVYFNGHPNIGYLKLLKVVNKFEIISLSEEEIQNFIEISNVCKKNILDLKNFYEEGCSVKTVSSGTFLATDFQTTQELINLFKI